MKKTTVMYTAVTLLIMSAIIAGGCAGTTYLQETNAAGITNAAPPTFTTATPETDTAPETTTASETTDAPETTTTPETTDGDGSPPDSDAAAFTLKIYFYAHPTWNAMRAIDKSDVMVYNNIL